jgi:hypothetical protein
MSRANILAKIQTTPDIDAADAAVSTHLESLLDYCLSLITAKCNFSRFPFQEQGYSKSGLVPGTDITALTSAGLLISINGSDYHEINLTRAGLDTGDKIATALQDAIRAAVTGADSANYFDFLYATAVYDDTTPGAEYYRINSPKYGPYSGVNICYKDEDQYLCRELKLGLDYGGEEQVGSFRDEPLEDAVAMMVANAWRLSTLAEEITERNVSEAGAAAFKILDENVMAFIQNKRRMAF